MEHWYSESNPWYAAALVVGGSILWAGILSVPARNLWKKLVVIVMSYLPVQYLFSSRRH
jgi:hypothetical protein